MGLTGFAFWICVALIFTSIQVTDYLLEKDKSDYGLCLDSCEDGYMGINELQEKCMDECKIILNCDVVIPTNDELYRPCGEYEIGHEIDRNLIDNEKTHINEIISVMNTTVETNDSVYNIFDFVSKNDLLNTTINYSNLEYSPTLNMSKLVYDGEKVQWVYQVDKQVDDNIYTIIACILLKNGTRFCEE